MIIPPRIIISPYHMTISPYHMIISPCHMIISPYHMIISPYHIIKLPYHTIKSLDHVIKSNPMDIMHPFGPLLGLRGDWLGKHLAPSPKSTHKITKKTHKIRKKKVHVKDEGKSSSEKLHRVAGYLFYVRDPPETSVKILVPKNI